MHLFKRGSLPNPKMAMVWLMSSGGRQRSLVVFALALTVFIDGHWGHVAIR